MIFGKKNSPSYSELVNDVRLTTNSAAIGDLFGNDLENKIPPLWAAISNLVNSLLQMPMYVVDENGNKVDDPINAVLKRSDFRIMFQDLISYGNGFGVIEYRGSDVKINSIVPYRLSAARWVNGMEEYSLYPVNSEYGNTQTNAEKFARADIIHFAGNGFNGLVSTNPSTIAKDIIDQYANVSAILSSQVRNSVTAKTILEYTDAAIEQSSPEDLIALGKKALESVKGKSDIVLLPAGIKLSKTTSAEILDSDTLAFYTFAIESIGRIFNIPARYLGIINNVRVANEVSALGEDFLRHSLQPRVKIIEDELSKLTAINKRRVRLDTSEISKGTIQSRLEVAKSAYEARLITREQALEYIGWAVDNEGERAAPMPGSQADPQAVNNDNDDK